MHAYLIIGDEKSCQLEVDSLAKKLECQKFTHQILKVADAKQLKSLTKFASAKNILHVLENFDEASRETQNSLLKTIEEPPQNTYFALLASKKNKILPTIISRCKIINLAPTKTSTKPNSKPAYSLSAGELLKITSKINAREDAINFLEEQILASHSQIAVSQKALTFSELAELALLRIKANANPQLQLTNLVVSLSSKISPNLP